MLIPSAECLKLQVYKTLKPEALNRNWLRHRSRDSRSHIRNPLWVTGESYGGKLLAGLRLKAKTLGDLFCRVSAQWPGLPVGPFSPFVALDVLQNCRTSITVFVPRSLGIVVGNQMIRV